MNKPYHELPDWILKSIGYFCDNYTIDGKDLGEMKRGAMATYRNPEDPWAQIDDSILQRLEWETSPQGFDFWDCLWFLMTWEAPNHQETLCAPWTDAENREIAKLPRVK
jgi:hypothetical protein